MKQIFTFFLFGTLLLSASAQSYDVTFKVNMNDVAAAFTTPEVNGNFNGWCGGCAPMSDPDGDNIWEITIGLESGTYEYKFAYDSWAGQESLTPGDPCTLTTDIFTNRLLIVSSDLILDVVCWGSCDDCDGVVLTQMNLPVTFEDVDVEYGLVGFGGAETSTIEVDPTDGSNTVAKVIKSATAELWAGTTVTNAAGAGFASEIPFSDASTQMTVKVWSPDAGIQVRLKVEDHLDPTKSVETEATTSVAGDWETLTFDFANEAAGTAELNLGYTYDKASIFFNFGVTGATAGEKIYYFDDVMFDDGGIVLAQMNLPVTFEDVDVEYGLVGFGGAETSTIEVDPTDGSNTVAKVIKSATAELWAGTTVTNAAGAGFASEIPFSDASTQMTVKVWSPDAGIQVRLKVEDHLDPTKSVETEATTSVAGDWETLTFDFANEAAGTAELNLGYTYDKASIFFNFGVTGATAGEKIYYFDDVMFDDGGVIVLYNVTFSVDMNSVADIFTTPEVNGTFNGWCGGCAPMSDADGDNVWELTIALEAGTYQYKFAYDSWAGSETLLDGSSCTITDGGFTNRALEVSSDLVLDEVCWASCVACGVIELAQMELPVTFEDVDVEYGLVGFGGAETSTIEVDPTDASNTVAKVIKSATAELWAGTTVTNAAGAGFASEIPFSDASTQMTVKVWSPDAGIQVRLKVEDHLDPTKSVETEATTSVAGDWETLTFDFANEAAGTAELNLGYTYDKASIFFNFGVTGATAGEKIYYFDDVMFDDGGVIVLYNVTFSVDMNSVADIFTTPEVNGTFNGWCGGCAPMSDADGDNVWELTIALEAGTYQYKFAYDSWAGSETLLDGSSCTITDGGFTNRALEVSSDLVLDEVCWASCVACATSGTSDITFIVDMNEVTDIYTTPEVNGTFNGWCGGCAPMSDANGDNIWELTIPLADTIYEYKFAYDSWAGSETLTEGSPCTVSAFGFTNRSLNVAGSAVLDTVCWASCNSCEATSPTHTVLFQVDMSMVTESYTTPEVNGTFNGWCGGCAPMSDLDGDNIWELAILLMEGTYDYKFAYDSWAGQETLTEGDPCTSTTDGFTNRSITVTADETLDAVCWGSCVACNVAIENSPEANITIYPQPATGNAFLSFEGNIPTSATAIITDITGRNLKQITINQNNVLLNLEELSAGIYQIIVIQNNQIIYSSSLSVQ